MKYWPPRYRVTAWHLSLPDLGFRAPQLAGLFECRERLLAGIEGRLIIEAVLAPS